MSLLDTFFNPDVIMSSLPALLRGFLNTLLLGIMSIAIGIPVGLLISLLRLYAPKPLRWLAVGCLPLPSAKHISSTRSRTKRRRRDR